MALRRYTVGLAQAWRFRRRTFRRLPCLHVGGDGLGMGEIGGGMGRQENLGHGRFPLVSEVDL